MSALADPSERSESPATCIQPGQPTASFRILYVFLVLRHERREIVHFNVTEHPTAQWTAQQMVFRGTRHPSTRRVTATKYTVRYSAVASRVSV